MTTSTPPTDTAPAEDRPRLSGVRLLAGNPVTVASAIVLACLAFVAVTAQWIAPFGINDIDVPNALRPPGGEHWFGTDELGRDVFSRVLVGVQASMRVAVVCPGAYRNARMPSPTGQGTTSTRRSACPGSG